MQILEGIILIIFGILLLINRLNFFAKGGEDTLGGNWGLIICSITSIIVGVIRLFQ